MASKASRVPVQALLLAALLLGCGGYRDSGSEAPPADDPPAVEARPTADPANGWTPERRERFWFTAQGSRVMPYAWFLALEQPDGGAPFRDAQHMQQLGYIPAAVSELNPGGLPIGFTREIDPVDGREYLGFTCAACHTNRVRAGTQDLVIDGAPTLADFERLERELYSALQQTAADEARFARFASAVLGASATDASRAQLREALRGRHAELEARQSRNRPSGEGATQLLAYGPARLDAFGSIMNSVESALAGGRGAPANAPVSYPCIWDAGQTDWVQWNGIASNVALGGALARNVGEVLGVFGHLDRPASPDLSRGLGSSVDLEGLRQLEIMMRELRAPAWPSSLPAPDVNRVARGRDLYAQACVSCHRLAASGDPGRQIQATLSPLGEIGTDPQMLEQIAEREAAFQRVGGAVSLVMLAKPCGTLRAAAEGTTLAAQIPAPCDDEKVRPTFVSIMKSAQRPPVPCSDPMGCYKAGPLHGVWATAPYLHNGSVPNLWELLRPPAERMAEFRVGSREIDPVHVGFRTDADSGAAFVFRTGLRGNWSSGHAYGTDLPEADRWALIEYMKTL